MPLDVLSSASITLGPIQAAGLAAVIVALALAVALLRR
jgi:hypothetical protein